MKQMFKPYLLVLCMGVALSACSGRHSPVAAPITNIDKELSCEELQLEIADSEYIRNTAMRNRGFNARNILWPFDYAGTYMSAEKAQESADRRLEYLHSVYGIKNCKRAL